MRPEKGIGAQVGRLLLVLAAAVVLSGFVGSDVPQNRPQAHRHKIRSNRNHSTASPQTRKSGYARIRPRRLKRRSTRGVHRIRTAVSRSRSN